MYVRRGWEEWVGVCGWVGVLYQTRYDRGVEMGGGQVNNMKIDLISFLFL